MDVISAAVDTVLPSNKFQIFSGILKASRTEDGKMRLNGVASSTTRDLHGDTMEQTALEDMERAANNNLTIFLNHSYEVPEDVAGSVESASMRLRGVDHAGNPNYDLDFKILVNDTNPRAVKAFEAIEKGTKLGLSIGALIPDGGAVRDKKSGTYLIQHVDLLETSLVGIPANPRSWVEYAAKSLRGVEKDATTVPLGSPTLTLDGSTYTISGTFDGTQWSDNVLRSTTEVTVIDSAPEEIVDAYQPGCDDCKPGQPCSAHKSVEPEVTDAQVTIIQIDTGDGSSDSDAGSSDAPQGGQSTDPDGDFAASGGDAVTASVEPETISELLSILRSTTGELVTARTRVVELETQLSAAEGERDAAVAESTRVLQEAKEILDKVADTPLMRRTVVADAQNELRSRFDGYFADDLLKMLEK